MRTTRRCFLYSAATSLVVSTSGCLSSVNGNSDHSLPEPEGHSRYSTSPAETKGKSSELILSQNQIILLENNMVKDLSTNETTEYATWIFFIINRSGTKHLKNIIDERVGKLSRNYHIEYNQEEDLLLISVIIEGGSQELAGPTYYKIKENAPEAINLVINTHNETISISLPVFIRAVSY